MHLGLPASLTRLTVQDTSADGQLEWALLEAAKCIRGGAQLCSLKYINLLSTPGGEPLGASLHAPYRQLGEQLSGLKDLSVQCNGQ